MRLAKFIYSTVVTAMLVATYFLVLAVFGIEITNELKGLGVALWLLAYHYAGVEFQLIDIWTTLSDAAKCKEGDEFDPPDKSALV